MTAVRRILSTVIALGLGVIAVGVLASNDQWAELVVPAIPGSAGTRLVTFEVQVWALLLVPLLLGAALGALLGRKRAGRPRSGGAHPLEEPAWPPTDPDRPA